MRRSPSRFVTPRRNVGRVRQIFIDPNLLQDIRPNQKNDEVTDEESEKTANVSDIDKTLEEIEEHNGGTVAEVIEQQAPEAAEAVTEDKSDIQEEIVEEKNNPATEPVEETVEEKPEPVKKESAYARRKRERENKK